MRVAAVQFKADQADLDGSRHRLLALATEAAQGADLVVLPEMATTGYLFESPAAVAAVAEKADGPTYTLLAAVAAQAGCWLVAGFPERDRGRLYNSAWVIDPRGALQFVYRKTLLFDADLPWATPGNSGYRRFETGAGAFGVGICMDLNDDDFVTWCRGADLDAIAFPTAWLEQGINVWRYWAWRLPRVAAALVAANTYGWERGIQFSGRSAILQQSRILAGAGLVGDHILRGTTAARQ